MMIGSTKLTDEIECGGSFFDHIDDLLDFPEDNDHNTNAHHHVNSDSFSPMWPNYHVFPPSQHITTSDLSAQLDVPYEDIVQMEWLSNFVEDSFSGGSMSIDEQNQDSNHTHQFHSSSPVSVLESSTSCSPAPGPARCGRARSKRPRPPIFNPRLAMHLISPTHINIPKPKKKIKVSPLPLPGHEKKVEEQESHSSQVSVRKCKHCEITKTPQWRAGPMGPKTLCNACGVRYKSGRLFPEYRPAASPTFVASQHSNSHKKVVEMRIKGVKTRYPEQEVLIPNANPLLLLDYM